APPSYPATLSERQGISISAGVIQRNPVAAQRLSQYAARRIQLVIEMDWQQGGRAFRCSVSLRQPLQPAAVRGLHNVAGSNSRMVARQAHDVQHSACFLNAPTIGNHYSPCLFALNHQIGATGLWTLDLRLGAASKQ